MSNKIETSITVEVTSSNRSIRLNDSLLADAFSVVEMATNKCVSWIYVPDSSYLSAEMCDGNYWGANITVDGKMRPNTLRLMASDGSKFDFSISPFSEL